MAHKIVSLDECHSVVKDKITNFFIDPDDKRRLAICLVGGGVIRNNYSSIEICKKNYDILSKCMDED